MTAIDRAGDRPMIHVVSYLAESPFGPRAVRTRRIVDALARRWEIDLVAGPASAAPGPRPVARRAWDYGLYRLYAALAMDRHETWSIRRLGRWRPNGAAALLIGYPYSPLAYASSALRRRGVPYVVDIGDPWAITARPLGAEPHSRWRGRRAERAVFSGATGAIFTTEAQASAMTALYPGLSTLVCHNGYDQDTAESMPSRVPPAAHELHLGHFGRLYGPRIDIGPPLRRLAASGRWRRIVLHQYGEVERGKLDSVPPEVQVSIQPARPWRQIQEAAARLSAVLVVGNLSPAQFPSKVVEYMTLPAPRVAFVRDAGSDAIADYAGDKTGWLIAGYDAPDLPDRIAAHVARPWTEAELAPPPDEAWPTVAARIARYIDERLGGPTPQ